MLHFCTYFNVNYLDRGIALYNSLIKHCQDFTLHILCMDNETEEVLAALNFSNVHLIPLKELEENVPELFEVKGTRTMIEYFFTCTPVLPWFLINHFDIDIVTYLDSDLYFYSSLEPLYKELGEKSVLITSHNFPPRLEDLEIFGKFNVGLLIFRNDKDGRACLEWWKDRCLEWCYDRIEPDRFADQKYLEKFGTLFNNVVVSRFKGVGLAPWNIEQYTLSLLADTGAIFVDADPLIFYHYQGLKKHGRYSYRLGLTSYDTNISSRSKKLIYKQYVKELHSINTFLNLSPEIQENIGRSIRISQCSGSGESNSYSLKNFFLHIKELLVLINKNDLIIVL